MVINFTISNYRSIKESQTISFEASSDKSLEKYYIREIGKYKLLRIGMILGANASGKSNILMAFSMFPMLMFNPCEKRDSKIKYEKFALDNSYNESDTVMRISFICNEATKYDYEVSFNNTCVNYEILRAQKLDARVSHLVYERILNSDTNTSTVKFGPQYRRGTATGNLIVNLLPNRTLFGSYQVTNVDVDWIKEIMDWAYDYFMPIVKTTNQHLDSFTTSKIVRGEISGEQVSSLLHQADIGVNDLKIDKKDEELPKELVNMIIEDEASPEELKLQLKGSPVSQAYTVKFAHQGANGDIFLNFNDESNGTKRFYELSSILILLMKESHFVCIDELENKLHPDLYKHFITTFLKSSSNSQLLFTTHMREFLDDRDFYRDDAVWIAEKDSFGATSVYSIADFGTDVIRNSTNRLNAYKAGKLGGIPRLGSDFTIPN